MRKPIQSEFTGLYVGRDEDREYLVTIWPDGVVEIATRDESWHTWGPPLTLKPRPTT